MLNDFSHFKTTHSDLSNHEWAKLVYAAVQHAEELLSEAEGRDVLINCHPHDCELRERFVFGLALSERLPS